MAEDPAGVEEARVRLARVGIEKIEGWLEGGILAWEMAGKPLAGSAEITAEELSERMRDEEKLQLVDVRRQGEWENGHIAGALLKPRDRLENNLDGLNRGHTVAVQCQGGYRSAIAASLFERAGFTKIINVAGGFAAWASAKLPVEGGGIAPACGKT